MLVSASITPNLRQEVADGTRPCPEFLRLEQRHGVELLDWTKIGLSSGHRSTTRSIRHVGAALRRGRGDDVIFSDGEHLGLPLAMGLMALGRKTPHIVIGHHLMTPAKMRVLRTLQPYRRMDRILVHSANQVDLLSQSLPALTSRLHVVPYGVDTDFWVPAPAEEEENLVVSAGREHRDYETLLAARPDGVPMYVADHSVFSPSADRRSPVVWPTDVGRGALPPKDLRLLYARAAVVAVPVVQTTFPAGITTVLEAMSMGKAVIASDTEGLHGVITDGESGLVVPPGDAAALNEAICRLIASPAERRAIGAEARRVALERYSLDGYVDELGRHLEDLRHSR